MAKVDDAARHGNPWKPVHLKNTEPNCRSAQGVLPKDERPLIFKLAHSNKLCMPYKTSTSAAVAIISIAGFACYLRGTVVPTARPSVPLLVIRMNVMMANQNEAVLDSLRRFSKTEANTLCGRRPRFWPLVNAATRSYTLLRKQGDMEGVTATKKSFHVLRLCPKAHDRSVYLWNQRRLSPG